MQGLLFPYPNIGQQFSFDLKQSGEWSFLISELLEINFLLIIPDNEKKTPKLSNLYRKNSRNTYIPYKNADDTKEHSSSHLQNETCTIAENSTSTLRARNKRTKYAFVFDLHIRNYSNGTHGEQCAPRSIDRHRSRRSESACISASLSAHFPFTFVFSPPLQRSRSLNDRGKSKRASGARGTDGGGVFAGKFWSLQARFEPGWSCAGWLSKGWGFGGFRIDCWSPVNGLNVGSCWSS